MFVTFRIFLVVFLVLSDPLSEADEFVTVVVVEYQALTGAMAPEKRLYNNAQRYIDILEKELGTDSGIEDRTEIFVVVYPESTLEADINSDLKSYSTEIRKGENPCTPLRWYKYPLFLRKLSCGARSSKAYLVVNLIEHLEGKFYSSDVIISSQGKIISSVRKDDRLGEAKNLHHPPIPFAIPVKNTFKWLRKSISYGDQEPFKEDEIVFCATSIVSGFRFSYTKVLKPHDSTHYLIASNWISELPFLTSLQVHQMWAQEFNVTLYFSGANNPEKGMGGTGIYHSIDSLVQKSQKCNTEFTGSKGPIFMNILPQGGSKAYKYRFSWLEKDSAGELLTDIADPDVDQLSKSMDDFTLFQDLEMGRFDGVVLNTSQAYTNKTICYDKLTDKFCCDFKIRISVDGNVTGSNRYTYQLVIFRGSKNYHRIFQPGGVEVCGIVACLNSKITSCGRRFPNYQRIVWPVTFKEIEIKSHFAPPYKEKIYYSSQFPNSLLSSIRPIHPSETNWTRRIVNVDNRQRLERVFSLKKPQNRILTFAIFSRNFTLVDPFGRNKCACSNRQLYKLYVLVIISLLILQN